MMDIRKIGKRQKTMILILVVAMMWSLYYRKFHRPVSLTLHDTNLQLQEVENKINALQAEFPNLELEQENLRKQKEKITKMESELTEIEVGLFRKEDMPSFLNELTENVEGIDFESIRPQEKRLKARERSKELYESYEVELVFDSSFFDLVNYVDTLRLLSPYINISHLHMELEESKSKRPRIILSLKTLLRKETGVASGDIVKTDVRELFKAPGVTKPFSPVEKPIKDTVSVKYKVTGLVWKGGTPVAIINNNLVKVGSKLDDEYEIVKIDENGVVIADEYREYGLKIEK